MMNFITIILAAVLAQPSFLQPLQKRDSVLVADQLRYGFVLNDVKPGSSLSLPDFSKGFMDDVEVIGSWRLDTLKVNGPKKSPLSYDISTSIVIAAFEEGEYHLPPLSAILQSPAGFPDTLTFDPQVLSVCTIPIDTATFVIHDIKGQIRYPLTLKEILRYLLFALLIVSAGIAAYLLWKKYRRQSEEAAQGEPAHIIALRKLDRFRGNAYWAPEKQKAFYSGVTDTLREYIASRYGVAALEMTTAELFEALRESDIPQDLKEEMKNLFELSDFVKFAKMTVSDEVNAKTLPSAIGFVTSTYQAQVEEEADNHETKEAE